jgi:5-methylcytosine-specific restriction endonuclease McrA
MRIKAVCTPEFDGQGTFDIPYSVGQGPAARTIKVRVRITQEKMIQQESEPISLKDELGSDFWLFRNRVVKIANTEGMGEDELLIHIKHHVLRAESKWSRIKKQVDAFENLERTPTAKRERIPESVRLFVWQRDEGKCVKCGSQEKLEYDHIIPFADGGSNTERNIQLLCEQCNRQKGKTVS